MMEDETTAHLEQDALTELLRASKAPKTCVCSSKVSRCQTVCGWGPKVVCNPYVRVKGKKTESKKQMTRLRNLSTRCAKTDAAVQEYFHNFKSRKQHIEDYRAKFSTVGQNCTGGIRLQNATPDLDPYLPRNGDHRNLFNRLKLLQTLSDFYNLGVSSRDLRRQAHLPPVLSSYKQIKKSSSFLRAQLDEEKMIIGVTREMQEFQIKDDAEDDDYDKEIGSTGCSSSSLARESSPEWPNIGQAEPDSVKMQQLTAIFNPIEHATVFKDYLTDLRRPSQKIIDGLHGSLKEELTVLRSGSDKGRKHHSLSLGSDRFADLKQRQARSDNRLAVKDKSVNSIPNMKNRKTLYISILGRNPLARESLNNT